jgi:hypothetical protein
LPGGAENHAHFTGADPVIDSNLLELDSCGLVGLDLVELRARPFMV